MNFQKNLITCCLTLALVLCSVLTGCNKSRERKPINTKTDTIFTYNNAKGEVIKFSVKLQFEAPAIDKEQAVAFMCDSTDDRETMENPWGATIPPSQYKSIAEGLMQSMDWVKSFDILIIHKYLFGNNFFISSSTKLIIDATDYDYTTFRFSANYCESIQIKTLEKIKESDFFNEFPAKLITDRVKDKLSQLNNNIDANQIASLMALPPNGNFCILCNGILYTYNMSDLTDDQDLIDGSAPIEIFIPYSLLNNKIRSSYLNQIRRPLENKSEFNITKEDRRMMYMLLNGLRKLRL